MSAECSTHGIHLVGMEDAYCPLCRCSELQAEVERLRAVLIESHGSYESLRAAVRNYDPVLAERARCWDGPILARSALSGESDD